VIIFRPGDHASGVENQRLGHTNVDVEVDGKTLGVVYLELVGLEWW
jgi:hypothetical protein